MRNPMKIFSLGMLSLAGLTLTHFAAAQGNDIKRTPSGHPDLSGTYDVSTLTPMTRPREYGDKMFLTNDEAATLHHLTSSAISS